MDTDDKKYPPRISDFSSGAPPPFTMTNDENTRPQLVAEVPRLDTKEAAKRHDTKEDTKEEATRPPNTQVGLPVMREAAPSTPLPEEDAIEKQFQSLEMSKIDLFSPAIQPVSPITEASILFPPSAHQMRNLPTYDKSSSHKGPSQLAPTHGVQQNVSGMTAPSTPPISSVRSNKQANGSLDGWKIEKVPDVPESSNDPVPLPRPAPNAAAAAASAAVSCILTSTDPADVLKAFESLSERLKDGPCCHETQNTIGQDARIFPLAGRLLSDSRTSQQKYDKMLRLLLDLCDDHAQNSRRLCNNDSALTAVLKIALKMDNEGGRDDKGNARSNAAVAAEILSFCMREDDNWDKVAAARSKLKKGLASARNSLSVASRNASRSSPPPSACRHSANYLARQSVIGPEYAA